MYTLTKEFTFEAAHKLHHHDGKCQRLHGHSWKARIVVKGESLQQEGPKQGMLVDYSDISSVVKPVVEEFLDHHYLNDTLKTDSPTSEYIAAWLFGFFSGKIPNLVAVEVDETCTCSCRYQPYEH